MSDNTQDVKPEVEKQTIRGKALLLQEQVACNSLDAQILKLRNKRLKATAKIDEEIATLELERDRTAAPYSSARREIESSLWEMIRMLGSQFENADCIVHYKSNGMYRAYNVDGLDMMQDEHPEVWELILPFRVEKQKTPTISVEWKSKDYFCS